MFFEEVTREKFDEQFDKVYLSMVKKLEEDPGYSTEKLKEFIESLYVLQGNDWLGRGEAYHQKLSATIAACETLYGERLEKE